MALIDPLWTFASGFQVRLLVVIVVLNMVLAFRLYGLMSKKRMGAAREGRVTAETYRSTQNEPEDLAVFTRAVANQFESPVLFYAITGLSLALGVTSWLTVILAGAYVGTRWRHASEMTGEHVVMRRRKWFIRSVQILMLLIAEVLVSTLIRA